MRLVEAMLDANRRFVSGERNAEVKEGASSVSLPVVALTCIDPRLNRLLPDALGIPEEEFIWLRNAGNIIFGPTSTMMRTLALACALKRGKEIIIMGHTECRVRQTTMLELTERFKELGIERDKLPDDLVDFFGLFASERQNVLKAVGFARGSSLIGPKVPVHGMLIDINTGALEWVVNGYDALGASVIGMPANGVATSSLLEATLPGDVSKPSSSTPDFPLQLAETRAADAPAVPAPRASQPKPPPLPKLVPQIHRKPRSDRRPGNSPFR
jgi:carbonic anhydrase